MRLFYDFHIHSCLSPCGDTDMTPSNIAGMAALCGLEAVALADHNTCRNTPAFLSAAQARGLIALPAMELTTSEEVHVLCLWPSPEGALRFSEYVYARLPDIPNDERIFGPQLLMGEGDAVLGKEPKLLASAAGIGLYDAAALVRSFGGVALPAHVDRPSFSLYANLGFFDPVMGFGAAELSLHAGADEFLSAHPELSGLRILRDSDAHDLGSIRDAAFTLEVREATAQGVIDALCNTLNMKFSEKQGKVL